VSKESDRTEMIASRETFDRLFNDSHQTIYRYCVRRLGVADAEDAAAEVFAVAWRRLDELPDGSATRAWLFGVAYRVVGNQFRSVRRRANLMRRIAANSAVEKPTPTTDDVATERLLEALSSLKFADAEVLRLSVWEGLSRHEIAQVLRVKENTVDQRLFRARTRLRAHFESLALRSEPEEASA
jgi:RNA polymerase sigma-70 factor, ECF subfamily